MGKIIEKYNDFEEIEQKNKIKYDKEKQDEERRARNERSGDFAKISLFIIVVFIVFIVIKECNYPGYISNLIQYGTDNASDFVDYISDYEYNGNSKQHQHNNFQYPTQNTTEYIPRKKILPDNIKEYIDSGYNTTFKKYAKRTSFGIEYIVCHNVVFFDKNKQKYISKQGNYYVNSNKYVLANIEYSYDSNYNKWYAFWDVYYFDGYTTEKYNSVKGYDESEMSFEYFDNCSKSMDEAAKYMGLNVLETDKDYKFELDEEKAFNLIGYIPE